MQYIHTNIVWFSPELDVDIYIDMKNDLPTFWLLYFCHI